LGWVGVSGNKIAARRLLLINISQKQSTDGKCQRLGLGSLT
jgi:hypothetical protein